MLNDGTRVVDILYGRNAVLEALRAGRPARKLVIASGTRDEARMREILATAQARGITIEESPRHRLDDIAHTEHHQGVTGYFHARESLSLPRLLDAAHEPALLLVLDGIQDPQNLGAMARTAEACAVDGIVLSRHHATGVTPAAAKSSAGAIEHMSLALVGNLAQALELIRERGLWRVGLDAAAPHRYDSFDYTQPVAIVVGAEGRGMRSLTATRCDALVHIPMLGHVASLNAAASAAVLLYEVQRQRGFARA
ncbi:MAG: 23S rRNA (guanosine(2251)-2'-O)-methyltransferase RlmB [Candidatus Dormibacteraeota bacterium]|nr:23S rRNA (guanosine(2251)-2'-O)-methyltransferase RlmB [Candidatus Dormibacteraeota bacterium]